MLGFSVPYKMVVWNSGEGQCGSASVVAVVVVQLSHQMHEAGVGCLDPKPKMEQACSVLGVPCGKVVQEWWGAVGMVVVVCPSH